MNLGRNYLITTVTLKNVMKKNHKVNTKKRCHMRLIHRHFFYFQNYRGTSDTFWVSALQLGECISQIEKGQHSCPAIIAKMLN